jgi:ABC-type Fe3+-siderophore transport system permease subunit
VLAGIACLFLFQALLSLLQFLASPEALQPIVFWLFGSLLRASIGKASIVALVLVAVLPALLADGWRLTALQLGDERAAALGVGVGALRLRAFVAVSLLTRAAAAFVGTIGFIGLVAPRIARMLVGEDQRHMMPCSAVFGALSLSLASVASKLILPGTVFPIGIVKQPAPPARRLAGATSAVALRISSFDQNPRRAPLGRRVRVTHPYFLLLLTTISRCTSQADRVETHPPPETRKL